MKTDLKYFEIMAHALNLTLNAFGYLSSKTRDLCFRWSVHMLPYFVFDISKDLANFEQI